MIDTPSPTTDPQDLGWCIVEIMGHRKLAGRVREQTVAGVALLRVDIYDDGDAPIATQMYGGAAIFCVTPTTEPLARQMTHASRPDPVSRYDRALPGRVGQEEVAQEGENGTEGGLIDDALDGPSDTNAVRALLAGLSPKSPPPSGLVESWPDADRREVARWARARVLAADGQPIEVPPYPACLPRPARPWTCCDQCADRRPFGCSGHSVAIAWYEMEGYGDPWERVPPPAPRIESVSDAELHDNPPF